MNRLTGQVFSFIERLIVAFVALQRKSIKRWINTLCKTDYELLSTSSFLSFAIAIRMTDISTELSLNI